MKAEIVFHVLTAWAIASSTGHKHMAGFLEAQKAPNIQFRRLGVTSAATEFGHLVINFDTKMLLDKLRTIRQNIPNPDIQARGKSVVHSFQLDLLQRRAQQTEEKLTAIHAAGTNPTSERRQKRFAFTLGVVAMTAILSLTAGLYAVAELKDIQRRANSLGKAEQEQLQEIEAMLHASSDLASIMKRIPEMTIEKYGISSRIMYFQTLLHEIEEKVTMAENAIRAATMGRLDVTTINASGFKKAIKNMGKYARENKLEIVTNDINDLMHVPTSITPAKNGFTLIAHVPMIDPASTLIVYQHIKLPLPAGEGFFFQLETSQDVLAIHEDDSVFKEMSMVELVADCVKLGNFYACPRGNAVRRPLPEAGKARDDPGLCLYAIFTGDQKTTNNACRKRIINPGPTAVQVTPRQFRTYGRTTGNVTCRSSKVYASFETQEFGNIHLPPGCTAHTEAFTLASGDSGFTRNVDEWAHTSTLTLNASKYLNNLDLKQLRKLADDADHALQEFSSISLIEAHKATEQANRGSFASWTPGALAGMGDWTGTFSLFTSITALGIAIYAAFFKKLTNNDRAEGRATFINVGSASAATAPLLQNDPPPYESSPNPMFKEF